MPTPAQNRKIWVSARELCLDKEGVRDMVESLFGHRSVSALTFSEAGIVIETMVRAGATPGRGKVKPSGRRAAPSEIKLISGGVRRFIQDLREQLGGKWTADRYFQGACQRVIKKDRPRTAAEGARMVEMLKARLHHEEAKRGQ